MVLLVWLWSIVKSVLNAIAKLIVFTLILVGALVAVAVFTGDKVPSSTVLELDLRKPIEDKASASLFDITADLSVIDVVMGLDRARRDPRVKGVFLRVGSAGLSLPKAEELREALKLFKERGKFVIAHSQSFYSGQLGDYVLAAAADEIWMQPVSTFFSSGAAATTLFFRGLFDKIAATPQFVQRHEYKNAANMFTEMDFTPAHREATLRVLQSWYDSAIAEAAADRELVPEALIAALDESPSTAEAVRERGLITDIGYDDEARDAAKARAGEGTVVMPFERYLRETRRRIAARDEPKIAFIHAAGDIIEGRDDDPLSESRDTVAGDTFAQAIRDAAADDEVRAILIRVDSPGGSAIASDQILQAAKKARGTGKPVVVSMGSVAASGGYYISLAADRIIAHPGTLTGSIGVIWGKVSAGGTLQKLGIESRELGVGKNALFLSGVTPWDDEQLSEVNQQADLVYADFTRKVAEGRRLPLDRVEAVARGRVWTGADAKERGLVDQLGGFWTAVAQAKTLAGIAPDVRVGFKVYPQPRGLVGRVSRLIEGSEAGFAALQGLRLLMQAAAVKHLLDEARALPDGRIQLRAAGLPAH